MSTTVDTKPLASVDMLRHDGSVGLTAFVRRDADGRAIFDLNKVLRAAAVTAWLVVRDKGGREVANLGVRPGSDGLAVEELMKLSKAVGRACKCELFLGDEVPA